MNNTPNHLTTQQLDHLFFDDTAAARDPHLLACADCTAELEALRSTFADLRSSATTVAAQQQKIASRSAARHRSLRPIGSLVAAALVLAISIPVTLHRFVPGHITAANHPIQTAPATNTTVSSISNISDEQLLTTVQSDLSASVPNPLQPLAPTTSTSTSTQ